MSELKLNSYLSNPNKELLDNIYPTIEKSLSNSSKSNAHQTDIRRFIDKNNEILFAAGPHYRLYFSDDERDKIFNHIGMRKKEIDDIIKKDKTVDKTWMLMRPFELSCTLVIRYYMLHKMKKQMENTILYLALSRYSSRHSKSFHYVPNENIMNYTVNNLSNKYKLKQFGTIIAAIKDVAMTNHNTYAEYLERGTDVLINSYIMQLNTRIGGFINKIANEYYTNYQQGKYLNTEEDDYSEENYHVSENDSFAITKLTNNVTTRIITKGIDLKICKLSANMCQVSVNGLQKSLQDIIYKKDKEIKHLISLTLQLYLNNNSNSVQSIGSKKFIDYCLQLYVKSNTNDKNILEIKDLLNKWLEECSELYLKTNRAATKNNLRKAVYLYIIFSIQQEAVKM